MTAHPESFRRLQGGSAGGASDQDGLTARFSVMGGEGEICVAGISGSAAQALIAGAVEEVRRIEAKYSRYRADSVISQINASAGNEALVTVDGETAGLLDFAAGLFANSEGRFDITSGVLRKVWDFRGKSVPEIGQIAALLPKIGWDKVRWRTGTDRAVIGLPVAGMELDFGGFGKEYAADRAAAQLLECGARHGYVNLGGDIRVFGPKPDGSPWHFGIRDPRQEGVVAAGVSLAQGALATSGDYERYLEVDGKRYCHILDPRSGWPVGYWRSVSVVAPLCIAAGALTTVAMLMESEAPEFLRAQGTCFLAIDSNGDRSRDASLDFNWSGL
jgi:thiamine biosynthesis lipoprotein